MLSELDYATFARYTTRGNSENGRKSRRLGGAVKNGNRTVIQNALKVIVSTPELMDFFGKDAILVPVPRSSLYREGNLWPTKVIAEEMLKAGIGIEVCTCLERITAVPKSGFQTNAADRPSVQRHYESLAAHFDFLESNNMILVEDIITLGRTTFACASRLSDAFPNATVKAFGLFRTRGFEDPNLLRDVRFGTMIYRDYTGNVQMPD
ncbi:hypothetical protein [Aquimarina mytili]|uniref:Phosphoribosyltransferase domain-containing protein n=1 Tax=Aquimarina mytili TaxID=874423 RepID=A0A936ZVD7_9FLAO|nr:hypothetical protein [Aquimarina mytili]MBL0686087.1 hypothetical protein [Aquimarina mytili]